MRLKPKNLNRWLLASFAVAGAAAISAVSVANIDPYAPVPHGIEPQLSRLEDFCNEHWGTMSPDAAVCRFEQTHYFNLTAVGGGSVQTGIPVLAGDQLYFEASDGAVPVIGKAHYEDAAAELKAEGEGYLSFRPTYGSRLVSLRKVRQQRCFRQEGTSLRAGQCEG